MTILFIAIQSIAKWLKNIPYTYMKKKYLYFSFLKTIADEI